MPVVHYFFRILQLMSIHDFHVSISNSSATFRVDVYNDVTVDTLHFLGWPLPGGERSILYILPLLLSICGT